MLSDQLRRELKIHASTLGEIAGGLDTGRKIVLVSPKNFFDLRDLLLEAEALIDKQQVAVRNQNEILSMLQGERAGDKRKIYELQDELTSLRADIREGRPLL